MRTQDLSRLATAVAASLLLSTVWAGGPVVAEEQVAVASTRADGGEAERATVYAGPDGPRVVRGRLQAAALGAAADGAGQTITFSEFPMGSSITRQYADLGVVFGGDSPFIWSDGANPTSPVLSGTPRFQGSISGYFEQPGGNVGAVQRLSLDVGYIDTPGSVEVVTYDARGDLLERVPVSSRGIVRVTLATPGMAAFVVRAASSEPAGFAIDNVSFPAVGPVVGIPLEQTFGFGDCNCFGSSTMHQRRTALPVNTATGADTETFTDISLPGVGVPFDMTRTYTSLDDTTGPLGRGWTHPYLNSLTITDEAVTVRAEDGQRAVYPMAADGSLVRPPGVRARLEKVGDGFLLTEPDQSAMMFDGLGQLVSRKNRFGDGLDLVYLAGELATVTDAAGRTVRFEHQGGLLVKVSLPDGRHVDYGYTDGYLTSVRDLRGKTTLYAYDADGRLASAQDPNGNYLFRNTYDPATGRVVSQLDARGRLTTFTWDPERGVATTTDPRGGEWRDVYVDNVLVRRVDPLGNAVRLGYDAQLNLVAVIDARGHTTTMTYDDRGNMLTRTAPAPLSYQERWTYNEDNYVLSYSDRRGNVAVENEYDERGLLTRSTDATGGVTRYAHDDHGLVRSVTDPRDKTTRYEYDDDGNLSAVVSPSGERTTRSYDDGGRLVAETDPRGNVPGAAPDQFTTSYRYDTGNLLVARVDALGRVTDYLHDDAGRLVSTTDPTREVTTYKYDEANHLVAEGAPDGSTTAMAYDDTGNLTRVTDPAGSTTYGYDLAGRRVSMTAPRGNEPGGAAAPYTWTYGYDANGNLVRFENPTAGVSTVTYDELNRAVATIDALGRRTTTELDANSNVTAVTDVDGHVTRWVFDPSNRVVSTVDPLGNSTSYAYDPSGNQISEAKPTGALTTWSYDDDGRLVSEVEPRGNEAGAVADDLTTRFTYFPGGLLHDSTDPLGHATSYAYDRVANLVETRDANGGRARYSYDELDRLASVTAPGSAASTRYEYDSVGNLVRRTDAEDHTTQYLYDPAHRLVELKRPGGDRWTFAYDAAGNRVETVTAAGTSTPEDGDGTVSQRYDELNRLNAVDYSDGTPDVTYEYDQMRLLAMTDGAGRETYGYDRLDRITSIARPGSAFAYVYDAVGRVTQRTLPNGLVVSAEYDADGRPTSLHQGADTTAFGYDVAGNLISTQTPEGVTETRTVDAAGRVTAVSAAKGNRTLLSSTLTLDPVGNPLTSATVRGRKSSTETFAYDAVNRLVSVCYAASCAGAPGRIDYSYDEVGNRLTENRLGVSQPGSRSYSYDEADRLLKISAGGTATDYGYDANGNQTRADDRSFAYDLAGRMVTATSPAGRTDYSYDGRGTRLTRATDGVVDKRFTWDVNYPLPALAAEQDMSTGGTRNTVVAPSGDTLYTFGERNSAAFLHRDALGNVADVTSNNGNSVAEYTYEPFGTLRPETRNGNQKPSTDTNPFRFQGQYNDVETGLYHLRARQYDPSTGRFTATDPVAMPLDDPYVSAYVYANNRPTVLGDPSGQCPFCIGAAIGAVGGAVVGGVSYAVSHDGDFTWSGLASSSGKGALVGAVAGATGGAAYGAISAGSVAGAAVSLPAASGASAFAGSVVGGAVSGAAGVTYDSYLSGNGLPTGEELAWATGGGALFGAGTFGAGTALKALCKPGTGLTKAGRSATTDAGAAIERWAWPANRGFLHDPVATPLKPGMRIDRYGREGGTFVSPEGTPFPQRALPPESANGPYHVYEVVGDLEVRGGITAPWFGQPGGGIQYELPSSVADLISRGILKPVR